ncbi:TonB-dependent receptor [Massilia sp. DD77]|uniref:TonB-dependent receptor n=1 Tax=Massilia sp. DD77 TaxID=3109349 RepID=UPI002FFE9BBF
MPFNYRPLAAAILLGFACPSQAQDQQAGMETVVVSALRSNVAEDKTAQTVVVIRKEAIEGQLAITGNSSEVLSNILPSYTPSRGKMNGSGETLRGRAPLILIDGVPQSNPVRPTGREAHTIDYAMVERIEIIQGPNAINGLGATGGTINIVTRRPEKGALKQHAELQVTAPTTDVEGETLNYKASYRLSGRMDKLDYLFALSAEDQGLHLDGAGRGIGVDVTQGDLMDSRSHDVLAKIGYRPDGLQKLQFSVNRYRIKSKGSYLGVPGKRQLGIPSTSIEGTPPGTPAHNDVWTSSASYAHADLAGMELSAMVFNQEFEGLFGADNSATFQDVTIAPRGELYDQSRAVASKYGSKLGLTKSGMLDGRLKLSAGVDTLVDKGKQDLYGTGRTFVPESTYRNLSLFTQGEYKLFEALTVHAGARREKADLKVDTYRTLAAYRNTLVEGGKITFDETLLNAGLVATPVRDVTLYASYSEGFGLPDIGRTLRSINTPGQSITSLGALAPILTEGVEAGVRVRKGDWNLDAAWYRSDSDLGTRVVSVNGVFMMAREKTRLEGVDASAGYRFAKGQRASLAYAYTRGRYDSDANGSLDARLDGLNVAPNRLIARWNADWSDKLSTMVQVQHAFKQRFDDPAKAFSGYSLADASLSYKLGKGQLRLGVANLFDKDYITYYSQSALVEPARYFAGRGRTLTLGYGLDL